MKLLILFPTLEAWSDTPTGDPFSNESGLLIPFLCYAQALWFAMNLQRWLWWGYWKFNFPFGFETERIFDNTVDWLWSVARVSSAEGAGGQNRLYQKATTSVPLCGLKSGKAKTWSTWNTSRTSRSTGWVMQYLDKEWGHLHSMMYRLPLSVKQWQTQWQRSYGQRAQMQIKGHPLKGKGGS